MNRPAGEVEPLRLHLGLIVPVIGYVILAPPALFLMPLGALAALAGRRHRDVLVMAALAGGFAAWWLVGLGTPPEQVVRAAAVIATAAFVSLSAMTRLTLTHRALLAVGVATIGVAAWVMASPVSWREVTWWVQYRATAMQVPMLGFLLVTSPGAAGDDAMARMESTLARFPDLASLLFPSIVALQVLAGLALGAWVAHRIGIRLAVPVGAFAQFRFSEHLGWFGVLGLATLLLAPGTAAAVAAANVVLLFGALYAARGAAVVWFGLRTRGLRSRLVASLLVVSALLLWQVSAATLVMLGVLDTGLHIRERWLTPRHRGSDGSHSA